MEPELITAAEWLRRTNGQEGLRPMVTFGDGGKMSLQASRTHYCTPRQDNALAYTAVELQVYGGDHYKFADELEDWNDGAVYAWVPIHVVELYCALRGGIVWGAI